MGRWKSYMRDYADECRSVSVSFLHKHGYFNSTQSGLITWTHGDSKNSISIASHIEENNDYIRFYYTQTNRDTGEKKDVDYKIPLVSTKCHFGGKRWWFMCPLSRNGVYCGKRVGVLYKGGDYFGCRHCYGLPYSSQYENYRSPLLATMNFMFKAEDLEKKMKRRTYAGRPTKKARRLARLCQRARPYLASLQMEKML
ncbi:MAG: hypothetical protein KGI50_00375 [Patescibacteria group bacterium]|nr:hypothetical protein [Patescibacteria group bacterium]MDE2438189.1 hypothetical protein [Patescibacteria group bacterium]